MQAMRLPCFGPCCSTQNRVYRPLWDWRVFAPVLLTIWGSFIEMSGLWNMHCDAETNTQLECLFYDSYVSWWHTPLCPWEGHTPSTTMPIMPTSGSNTTSKCYGKFNSMDRTAPKMVKSHVRMLECYKLDTSMDAKGS